MARTTKAERARAERRGRVNVLAVTLFELEGKLTQVARHARDAGLPPIADESAFWRTTVSEWRAKINDARKRTT